MQFTRFKSIKVVKKQTNTFIKVIHWFKALIHPLTAKARLKRPTNLKRNVCIKKKPVAQMQH